jgi:diguanylate cyclase (GGDEF)-like protein
MQSWEDCVREQKLLYIKRALDRLVDMERLLDELEKAAGDTRLLRQLSQHFHQLAGSAGILESQEFFRVAKLGEEKSAQFFKQRLQLEDADIQAFKQFIMDLKLEIAVVEQCDVSDPGDEFIEGLVGGLVEPSQTSPEVLVVGLSESDCKEMVGVLSKRGLKVRFESDASLVRNSLESNLPAGLIVGVPLPGSEGYELAQRLRELPGSEKTVVIIVGKESNFIDNVRAIQSGADAFFDNPQSWSAVSEKLIYLLDREKPQNYRILYVEDDHGWAEYVCKVLEVAGYNMLWVSDPQQFEQSLLAYDPQLVLLDINLGDISGYDLARFLRQNERFANLPIIFLTTKNELEAHIESARAGGDDHLIKPIAPPLLVATVAGRLERYRMLQKLISRDGLTQCLTFSSFMDEGKKHLLTQQSTRAMLLFEIDDIWPVNEQFGFASGDKLIVALSVILKRTLRPTEIIGRIGGGKFAIIVDGMPANQLSAIATYILGQFQSKETMIAGVGIRRTASAGFSMLKPGMDVARWLESAEEALKSAKAGGGNRVCERS